MGTNKLPKPLTKEELYSYLEQYKQGDFKAREKVIIHNIRLVLNEVHKKFANTPYARKELVSIGIVGLIKGVDTFDIKKNFEFATYAARCIDNEILMFLRKEKNSANIQSIYAPIGTSKNGDEINIEDVLEDKNSDFVSNYENQFTYNEIRKVVYSLPDRDREIILLYFGFNDNHPYTQKEISDKLKLSRPYVSRLITEIINRIKIQLQDNGVIEKVSKSRKKNKIQSDKSLSSNTPAIDIKSLAEKTPVIENENITAPKIEEKSDIKMRGKRLQTIYEYLKEYTREEIDAMLSKLSNEEMSLVKLRYGDDLDNPVVTSTWGIEQNKKFYGYLIPKMKRLLSNPDGTRKKYPRKPKTETSSKPSEMQQLTNVILNPETNEKEVVTPQLITPEESQKEISKSTTSEIEKEDYIKILELMRTPNFEEMLKNLTPKEAVIICLKLGYVDGKYFTTESVAEFLGIENDEVIETTKKVLLLYKENINQFIDKAVELTTGFSLGLKKKEN